ncbi:unnamed protein product [Ambrosiozyma monospora]|uniref:Unnamed protein product n=1 Tax=Ambrosiozyma monospora TaxID=43982 RepID=A0ACB5T7A4_AMBMO|nr:unnamed protein product [Ambrosiozyma monospora]
MRSIFVLQTVTTLLSLFTRQSLAVPVPGKEVQIEQDTVTNTETTLDIITSCVDTEKPCPKAALTRKSAEGTDTMLVTTTTSPTNDPTLPTATIKSSDTTSKTTLFSSELPDTFTPETGSLITTITTTSTSSNTVQTQSSSLTATINTGTISEAKTASDIDLSSSVPGTTVTVEVSTDTTVTTTICSETTFANAVSTYSVVSEVVSTSYSMSSVTLVTTKVAQSTVTGNIVQQLSDGQVYNPILESSTTSCATETTEGEIFFENTTSTVTEEPSESQSEPVISTSSTSSASTSSTVISIVTHTSVPVAVSTTSATIVTTASSDYSTSTSTLSTSTTTHSTAASSTIVYGGKTVDLFQPIGTGAPADVFERKPLSDVSLADGVDNNGAPIETNKFYVNLLLGKQSNPVYTYPYSFFYTNTDSYHGLGMTHVTSSVFGDTNANGAASYLGNAILVGSFIFSSTSLTTSNTHIEVTEMKSMSVLATITDGSDDNYIDLPLVEGMGFGTAVYNGDFVAQLSSNVGFKSLVTEKSDALATGIVKYRVTLFDDVDWLVYAVVPKGSDVSSFQLSVSSVNSIVANVAIDGLIIQVAPAPENNLDSYYDEAAGMYPTDCSVQGSYLADSSDNEDSTAFYQLNYATEGSSASGYTLIFALAHQVDSLTSQSTKQATGISIYSPAKGDISNLYFRPITSYG